MLCPRPLVTTAGKCTGAGTLSLVSRHWTRALRSPLFTSLDMRLNMTAALLSTPLQARPVPHTVGRPGHVHSDPVQPAVPQYRRAVQDRVRIRTSEPGQPQECISWLLLPNRHWPVR